MIDSATIYVWGKPAASLSLDSATGVVSLEYDPAFVREGEELSPIYLPLQRGRVYAFPELNRITFKGLPGFVADALPDKFGNDLIDRWLARQGRDSGSYNVIERLLYQGQRAMGALTFEPAQRVDLDRVVGLEVESLVETAARVLLQRAELAVNVSLDVDAMETVLRVGTSAGGARAKAVVAYNHATGELRSGQLDAPAGFEHYLLKLDGVDGNTLGEPLHYGEIEYAYYRMAQDCGIEMTDSFLLEDGKRRHFMTRRFDREGAATRIHMVSLCGMANMDFNMPGAYGYEQLFAVMRNLHLPYRDAVQAFRRMVFNVVGRNQDDHTKNFSFLLPQGGQWRLAPAYDMTYAYNSHGDYTSAHQMSINGKRDGIDVADLLAVADYAKISKAKDIIADVVAVFRRLNDYLPQTVPLAMQQQIKRSLRLF